MSIETPQTHFTTVPMWQPNHRLFINYTLQIKVWEDSILMNILDAEKPFISWQISCRFVAPWCNNKSVSLSLTPDKSSRSIIAQPRINESVSRFINGSKSPICSIVWCGRFTKRKSTVCLYSDSLAHNLASWHFTVKLISSVFFLRKWSMFCSSRSTAWGFRSPAKMVSTSPSSQSRFARAVSYTHLPSPRD